LFETFEEAYQGRLDYHPNNLEKELLDLSIKYPEVTFLLRECSTDLDYLTFDYFWNGKTCHREMKIETPLVSKDDFK